MDLQKKNIKFLDLFWKILIVINFVYVMKFMFHISNNELEYEALIAWLQMAQNLKIA